MKKQKKDQVDTQFDTLMSHYKTLTHGQMERMLTRMMRTYTPRPGYTLVRTVWEEERHWHSGKAEPRPILRFEGDGVTIDFIPARQVSRWSHEDGHGSVNFDTAQGRRTFDRRGVDDSFQWRKTHSLDKIINGQLAKVETSRARLAASVPVPGLPGGWVVTDERKTEVTAKLKAGREATFTPAGFGIGYRLTTRPVHRFSKRGSDALAAFFGVEAVWYDTLDCD